MVYVFTDDGRDFFENATVDPSYTEIIDTIAIGDGSSSPNNDDTSLDNSLFEADTTSNRVTIERGGGTGEIRATVEFTGGNEVPSDSEVREFGFKSSDDLLVYRERRSAAIDVPSGETRIVEIRAFVEDADAESEQAITDVGREYIADRAIGNTTERIDTIAVGDSTGTVSDSNTLLDSPLYSADDSNNNVIVETTSNIGDVRAEITVTAGSDPSDNVPANSEISEFGLFSNGTLVLHEKRTPVTLEGNDTKTFKIPLTIIQ
jgi:hypothetical protein